MSIAFWEFRHFSYLPGRLAPGRPSIDLRSPFRTIRSHGMGYNAGRLDRTRDVNTSRDRPGHRQHRFHLDSRGQVAGGTTEKSPPNGIEPGTDYARSAA